jgi:hypothetical protein
MGQALGVAQAAEAAQPTPDRPFKRMRLTVQIPKDITDDSLLGVCRGHSLGRPRDRTGVARVQPRIRTDLLIPELALLATQREQTYSPPPCVAISSPGSVSSVASNCSSCDADHASATADSGGNN